MVWVVKKWRESVLAVERRPVVDRVHLDRVDAESSRDAERAVQGVEQQKFAKPRPLRGEIDGKPGKQDDGDRMLRELTSRVGGELVERHGTGREGVVPENLDLTSGYRDERLA